jgi:hypothetical protein
MSANSKVSSISNSSVEKYREDADDDNDDGSIDTPDSYYNNFTKFVINSKEKPEMESIRAYSYSEWKSSPNSIHSLKIADLKHTLKTNGMPVSGKKNELIHRVVSFYKKIRHALNIQRVFRGFLVRESERMRGEGYPDRTKCLNDTDFHTMDSVCDIPREEFFSYRDLAGFVYGFNVFSLMAMFNRNRKIENPYNREDMPVPIVCKVFSLYKKILILYPLSCNLTRFHIVSSDFEQIRAQETRRREDEDASESATTTTDDAAILSDGESDDDDMNSVELQMSHLQYYSTAERISMVFERMSELMDRTCRPQWFLNLNKNEYARFYNYYYTWWSKSSTMTERYTRSIYPLDDPFHEMPQVNESTNEEFLRGCCMELIERMVYSGDGEHWQRNGAKHTLMILTVVSREARNAFPHLFDAFS